tara:strand:- start:10112 stop:11539 length:1428 start_codon:yes stop_codon:yes gene_type:complete
LKPRKPRHEVIPESKGPARAQRKQSDDTFANFFEHAIRQNNGVFAALPRSTLDESVAMDRVVRLDATRNVGSAMWWTQRLITANYSSSYKHTDHYIYSTDGLDRNEWFPRHTDIDVDVSENGFDYLTLGGFSVTIRALSSKEFLESGIVAHRFAHEIEAAALGVGPAIIASFLIAEQKVVGQAFVTQRHTFRLSDLLKEYNRFKNSDLLRPGMSACDASIYELTAGVARKVRLVANARLLKMNMTADSVVFCPHLVEDDNGAMTASGYGFGRCETKGVPYLTDFDPVHTKRGTVFNADAAYLVMMTQLLGTIRAQFGDVYGVMLNKLTGKSPSGAILPEDELPENFAHIDLRAKTREDGAYRDTQTTQTAQIITDLLKTMPTYKTVELVDAYAEAAADVAAAMRQTEQTGRTGGTGQCSRPLFQKLAAYHLRSASPDTSLTPMTAVPVSVERVTDRLSAVRIAREEHRRSPHESN